MHPVVRGPLPDVHQPESATLPSSGEGTSSGLASMRPSRKGRNEMHPEELMKPDLFSEIMLLGIGELIFVALLLIVVAALTRS